MTRATATEAEIRQFRLQNGDVVLTKDSETPFDIASPALVTTTEPDIVCGYHLTIVRPEPEVIDPSYLFWTLASAHSRGQLGSEASGVTRFGLRVDSIANLVVRVPSIARQRAIAEHLERLTSQIDRLRTHIELQLGLLAERSEAVITAAVTGQIDVTREAPSPPEEAPEPAWALVEKDAWEAVEDEQLAQQARLKSA